MKCECYPFLRVVCAGILVVCCFLAILFFKLCISCSGKPLCLAIVYMVFHSCCFACSVMYYNLQPCQKGKLMNCWETLYIRQLQQQQLLIEEQRTNDINPLYSLANTSHHTNQTHHCSVDT